MLKQPLPLLIYGLLFLVFPQSGFSQQTDEENTDSFFGDSKPAQWSKPAHIPLEKPENQMIIHPQAVVRNDSIYLVFQVNQEEQTKYGRPYLPKDIYVITNFNGHWTSPVNVSRSDVASARPRLAWSGQDSSKLHLIWGEQRMPLAKLDGPPRPGAPDAIRYASGNSEGWSEPFDLFQSIRRALQFPKHLVTDAEGRLHFIFKATDSYNKRPRIYYIRYQDTSWTIPQIIATGAEADLIRLTDGRMLLAYTRADSAWARRNRSRDINSIFVKISEDGGATWGKDILVHRSGLNPSYSPQLVEDSKGRIHLLWRQDANGNQYPDLLAHSYSADGINWNERTVLADAAEDIYPKPSYLYYFNLAATPDGKIYAIFCMGGVGVKVDKLFFTYLDDEGWRTPEPLFDFDTVTSADLVYDKTENQLHLFFSAGEKEETKLYHSTYRLPR